MHAIVQTYLMICVALTPRALLGDGPFTLVQTSWLGKAFVSANARQEQAL